MKSKTTGLPGIPEIMVNLEGKIYAWKDKRGEVKEKRLDVRGREVSVRCMLRKKGITQGKGGTAWSG